LSGRIATATGMASVGAPDGGFGGGGPLGPSPGGGDGPGPNSPGSPPPPPPPVLHVGFESARYYAAQGEVFPINIVADQPIPAGMSIAVSYYSQAGTATAPADYLEVPLSSGTLSAASPTIQFWVTTKSDL